MRLNIIKRLLRISADIKLKCRLDLKIAKNLGGCNLFSVASHVAEIFVNLRLSRTKMELLISICVQS